MKNDKRRSGTPAGTRNKNIVSPYQQRAKSKNWTSDREVEPALVVNGDDLATFDRMCAARPLQPPRKREPEVSHAAAIAARKDGNGVA